MMVDNKEKDSITYLLEILWGHISKKRHYQLGFIFILMLFSSVAEILSIGSVIPFLSILTSPEQVFHNVAIQPVIIFFDFKSAEGLVLPITICFISATIFAGVIRLILVFVNTRFSFAIGHDLSINIYNKTLLQPFHVHIDRNSSEIVNGIASKTDLVIFQILLPFLNLLSSIVMIFIITTALVILNPLVAISVMGGLGLIYCFLIKITSFQLLGNSQIIADKSTIRIKSLQEGLGGIRDILLSGTQGTYCNIFKDADLPLRRSQANNAFISLSPRYAMEALGMVLIAIVAFHLTSSDKSAQSAIPLLGTLAFGAQRLLPMLQLAYQGWSSILGGYGSLVDILGFLDQKIPKVSNEVSIDFNENIILKDMSFRYKNDQINVLDNINLEIPKGSCVGFIGPTGSGKSTMADILMGLLVPTSGTLMIDGKDMLPNALRSWQKNISHVAQDIFLSDNTIKENVAFGVLYHEINMDRVVKAVSIAQIDDVINDLPEKYNTLVGERGIRLSGGQNQRIGIARALYNESKLMVFDEATSALDNITERAVMGAVNNLLHKKTIIMIAHRLSSVRNCDIIYVMDKGRIVASGSYEELLDTSVIFKKMLNS